MRLIDMFDRGAALYPNRVAFTDGIISFTYAEAKAYTCKIANGLIAGGLMPGGKVAVYSYNDVRAFLCILGIARAGGTFLILNVRGTLEENTQVLAHRDTEWLFIHSDFAERLDPARAAVPGIGTVIGIDKALDGCAALDDWVTAGQTTDPDIWTGPEHVASLFTTGGTTGLPKGCMQTNLVLETMAANALAAMPYKQPPVHLMAAPMSHAAGLAAFWLMAVGATQVIRRSIDPEDILASIDRFKVTTLFLPPTAIYMMLAHPKVHEFDYSSLKHFIYAAAPMSVDRLKEALEIFGPVMTQVYGQAEAPMLCTSLGPEEHLVLGTDREGRLGSCGRQSLFTPVGVMAPDGELLPAGERGEIVVRGNLVMSGYYKNPEATEAVSGFGWHHTGDVGMMDEDGFLYIVDRLKDMIISGGFNVFPSEIEQVIWALPEVQDCAVVGVPDEKWGEAVKAVIELNPGQTLDEQAVIARCKEKLGSVKAPKSVDFWETLPRSTVGKVLKRDIREKYWAGKTRKI